ncbi:MAG: selenoprotein O, partial [Microvirga sp.]
QDGALAKALWTFLHESKAPFEQTFFDWYGGLVSAHRAEQSPSANFYAQPSFQPVRAALESFAPAPQLQLDHPYFAGPTPCTMLIDEVEALWAPIAAEDDWSRFQAKLAEIRSMAEAYGAEKLIQS